MHSPILTAIREALNAHADAHTAASIQRLFKEEVKTCGIPTPVVRNIARAHFRMIRDTPKADIFALCEVLWQSGYMEEITVACDWCYAVRRQFTTDDHHIFAQWIDRYVDNWAACDTLCTTSVGTLIEMYTDTAQELYRWTQSDNRWMKRAAAVALITPARKGLLLNIVFDIVDRLLTDPDDMVQKGYGWLLKVAGQRHEQEVARYVLSHKARMPRTAYRYAIEKWPPALRTEAMKK
ncbi:MAG: DNA alkylation repair protein [Prevotellaceae bacterium]|jgi:3-methyladenine DNA glycosylase AlkD|nr:DNA alkylation repair protein [Prevotellaceae bacterium]